MNIASIALLPCLLLLSACGQAPQTPPAEKVEREAARESSTPESRPATMGRGFLLAKPSSLPNCEPAVVQIAWDTRAADPDLTDVKVSVIAPGESAGKLFAAGGATDKAVTGAWVKPGLSFQLHDGAGKELDRITIGGPACP